MVELNIIKSTFEVPNNREWFYESQDIRMESTYWTNKHIEIKRGKHLCDFNI